MKSALLPEHFCWTKYGVESGESVCTILRRKEEERQASGGMFLWGIGNSVGPAVRELIRREHHPKIVFSPMRSKAKAVDTTPSSVFTWSSATGLDGSEWEIPEGLSVLSRGSSEAGRMKASHYALVCKSDTPLMVADQGDLVYENLVNLLSQNPLGHSQVTAVVSHHRSSAMRETKYPIGFMAELVYPYFVKLYDPIIVNEATSSRRKGQRSGPAQASLLAA